MHEQRGGELGEERKAYLISGGAIVHALRDRVYAKALTRRNNSVITREEGIRDLSHNGEVMRRTHPDLRKGESTRQVGAELRATSELIVLVCF